MVGLILASNTLLCRLPTDIVCLIVRAFYAGCASHLHPGRKLRRLCALAAVDSQWRRAVEPLLYGSVVCEERAGGRWATNAALLSNKLGARWVRRLEAVLGGGAHNDGSQQRFSSLFGNGFFCWPRLAEVRVIHGSAGLAQQLLCARVSNLHNNAVDLHHHKALLPDVMRALLRADMMLTMANALLSKSAELVEITTAVDSPAVLHLVRRAASTLTALRLTDIEPVVAARDVLALLDNARPHGAFARLRSLALDFSTAGVAAYGSGGGGGESEVPGAFAQLRAVALRHCPGGDVRAWLGALQLLAPPRSMRQRSRFPRVILARLEVCGSTARVPDVVWTAARSVRVACVGPARPSAERAERLVRAALAHSGGGESLCVGAVAARPLVRALDGALVACVRLQTLELRVPLALAVVTPIVAQLPQLRRLTLPYVATESLMVSRCDVLPSRSLRTLALGFWDCRHDPRALAAAVLRLAEFLPVLLSLVLMDARVAAAARRLRVTGCYSDSRLVITDHASLPIVASSDH
ncbi:hypothetical protein GGI04_000363 [Coemansia thaxteri]|nr:hypothetical protein GGI04_000363 [Coemansia thaxteri]KAJ2474464.1 hypothetical protein GGI02_000086 [Coemansia sp. RSA 2322]